MSYAFIRNLALTALLSFSVLAEPRLLGGSHFEALNSRIALINIGLSSYCSGLLVGKRHILTAAHCLPSTTGVLFDFYRVRLGNKLYTVDLAYRNSGFTPSSKFSLEQEQYDSAVIILSQDVLDRKAIPVIQNYTIDTQSKFTFFGFGRSSKQGSPYEDLSNFASFTISEKDEGLFYAEHSTSGASICGGDSGGPGIVTSSLRSATVAIAVAGTNRNNQGICSLEQDGSSAFVNLQSEASQRFLAEVQGIEYVSGSNMLIEDAVISIRTKIIAINNAKQIKKALKSLVLINDNSIKISDLNRKKMLISIKSTINSLAKTARVADFRRIRKKLIKQLDNLLILGVN